MKKLLVALLFVTATVQSSLLCPYQEREGACAVRALSQLMYDLNDIGHSSTNKAEQELISMYVIGRLYTVHFFSEQKEPDEGANMEYLRERIKLLKPRLHSVVRDEYKPVLESLIKK